MKNKLPVIIIAIGALLIVIAIVLGVTLNKGNDPYVPPTGIPDESTASGTPDTSAQTTTPDISTPTTEPDTTPGGDPVSTEPPEESTTEPVVIVDPDTKAYVSDKTMVGSEVSHLFSDLGLMDTYNALFFYTQNIITVHVTDPQNQNAANVTVKLMGHREGRENIIVLAEQKTNSKGFAVLCYNYGFVPTTIEADNAKVNYEPAVTDYQLTVSEGVSYNQTAYLFSLYEASTQSKYRTATYEALNRFIADKNGNLCGYNLYNDCQARVYSMEHMMSPVVIDDAFNFAYNDDVLDTSKPIGTANTKWSLSLIQLNVQDNCENIAFIVMDGESTLNVDGEMDKIFIYAVRELAEQGVRAVPIIMPEATDRTKVFAYTIAAMTNAPYIQVSSVDEIANLDIALNEAVNMLHAQ